MARGEHAFLLLILLASACSGPDEFTLGASHTFAGDSTLAHCYPIDNEDSNGIYAGFTWQLKPKRVVIESPSVTPVLPALPPLAWQVDREPPERARVVLPKAEQQAAAASRPTSAPAGSAAHGVAAGSQPRAPGDPASNVKDAISFFDNLNWVTQVLLVVLALVFGWMQRERIGRIPIFKFLNRKKAPK